MGNNRELNGKVLLQAKLVLETGLHIGGTDEFSAIGAIDSPVVRDIITRSPYIPGSSLKGKMRFLLARQFAKNGILGKISDEDDQIKRLFGASGKKIMPSRLQFYDIFICDNDDNNKKIGNLTGGSLTETKAENTINRISAKAMIRQIERVVKGTTFEFKLSYTIENSEDIKEDFDNIKKCFYLLENDYLGGGGTRGSGRIKFNSYKLNSSGVFESDTKENVEEIFKEIFEV